MVWLSQMFTWVVKKCLNLTFKVNFLCQKSFETFGKKISLKNICLEEGFCYCHFLKTSTFEPLCFLKWCPIFDGPCEHHFHFTDFLIKPTPCWLTSAKLHHWGHTTYPYSRFRIFGSWKSSALFWAKFWSSPSSKVSKI